MSKMIVTAISVLAIASSLFAQNRDWHQDHMSQTRIYGHHHHRHWVNHGYYVSKVAHMHTYSHHGRIVSLVARRRHHHHHTTWVPPYHHG
jgi:hypothetical protein